MKSAGAAKTKREFNPNTFLATIGDGRKVVAVAKKKLIFAQGDGADAVFYIQKGKVRLTVVSKTGKEATIGIVNEGNFFGEGSLAGQLLRLGPPAPTMELGRLRVGTKAPSWALHPARPFSDRIVSSLRRRA